MILETVVYTVVFTVIFLVVYKLVVNPTVETVIDPSKMSKCPDSWTYNGTECVPATTTTSCFPFNPDATTLTLVSAKCNLARMCGTTWSGVC